MTQLTEDLLLAQLIRNDVFREKVISYVKPTFFEDEVNIDFFKSLSNLVLVDKVKVLDRATLKLRVEDKEKLESLFSTEFEFSDKNTSFLVIEAEKWAQRAAIREALQKSVDFYDQYKHEDRFIVGNLVKEAMSFSFEKNMGLSYKRDIKRRFEFYNRIEEKLPTGYDLLDFYTYGGFQKKTLSIIMASSGLGKTLLGTNLAAMMSRQGHNGIYLTLELAEEFIARRMDSINLNCNYNEIPVMQKEVEDYISKNIKGDVRIREYAPSKASAINILSYVRELEEKEKFKADFLAVDYIQLMKANNPRPNSNSYEKYKDIAEELRELAQELDIPVISFSQVNRSGYDTSNVGLSSISDSMGIINCADFCLAMSQTAEELLENYQTWRIVKNRMGRRGIDIRVHQDPSTLKFSQVLNPEETRMLADFRERRKYSKLELNKEADLERNKETDDIIREDFNKLIGDSKKIDIYDDFK